MISKKISRFKPFYKKLINLRESLPNQKKVFNFKSQKWIKFIEFYKKKLRKYKKFKPQNPNKYIIAKYPNRFTSYVKKYKVNLQYYKVFNLFYGNVSKASIKAKIHRFKKKNIKNLNFHFLEDFERKLYVILYRAKFFFSMRSAQQAIVHGNILVNNKVVKKKTYQLKSGDLIRINPQIFNLVHKNLPIADVWPLPPKYLAINYKTLEIIVLPLKDQNFSTLFSFHVNLEKILGNLPRI